MYFTLAVSVATDGIKSLLFIIFQGRPDGSIEESPPVLLPDGVDGCVLKEGWMDNRTNKIWYNTVQKYYCEAYDGESALLLDDFICHEDEN